MREIELSGGTVEYEDTGGDGPVLVFLHGVAMDGSLWRKVVADLHPDHRCIIPTLPLGGHRRPMRPDADLSILGVIRLVAEFMEWLDLRCATLVGNDWGGAQLVVSEGLDERVERLVLTSCEAFDNRPENRHRGRCRRRDSHPLPVQGRILGEIFGEAGVCERRGRGSRKGLGGHAHKRRKPLPLGAIRSLTKRRTLLLVCGEGHKPGQADDTVERYERLEEWARERFGVADFQYRWSTQDYWPADGIPFAGRLGVGSRNVWVGTGFSNWGITGGTASAMILTDLIGGRKNPHASLFDSTRTGVLFEKGLYKEGVDTAKRFVGDWVSAPEAADAAEIKAGEGRGPEKVAAYRDGKGELHAVSATCTHLGCVVQWNAAEESWDCPCHASRFSVGGEVLQGPAVKDLKKKRLAGEGAEP